MNEPFLKILNMSLSASWLILAVLLLRLMLQKGPKWVNVLLWGIVALRLLFPFSIQSALSLIPSAETIQGEALSGPVFTIQTGIAPIDSPVNDYLAGQHTEGASAPADPGFSVITLLTIIWMIGALILLVYAAVSCLRLQQKVCTAVPLRRNVYQSENISSPFVLGIIRPKIYVPFHVGEQDLPHVIAHEQAHIRRKDHWWKPLGFLLLAIHWFNPLMWLAYVLLCRDIELACDEKVIQDLCSEQRANYTQALLACSVGHRMAAAYPLAFGEVGVKKRVRAVMNYKKPAFWIVIAAVLACAAVAVCFLTDPIDETDEMDPGVIAELEQYRTEWIGDAPKVSHIAQLLPYPKDYHYSSLELQTREEPYELIVYLNGTDPVQQEDFENCAAIAFDLIGNMGILSFRDARSEATIASFARTDEDEHDLKSMGNSSPANPSATNPDSSMLLTQRSAEETITQILATLTVHSDETVSLTLPQIIPVSEDGKTKLTISMNAAFSDAPGSYTVQKLLEEETGWQGGESPRISLDTERGELVSVTLNVFYMTELDASTRSIYAQGNVDASAPFSYDVPLGYTTPSVQIEQMGQAATLHYTLPDGSTSVLSLRLPQNMAAVAGEDLQILLTQTGEAVGSVNLYPFGAADEQALQQIDPAVNALPMQNFSTIALSNHAGYDGYQVRQYSSTGAVATAKFIWQDLSSDSAAASIPWQEQDCVLVYDWGVMPYFVEIKLAQGLCSERELTELAESIKLE